MMRVNYRAYLALFLAFTAWKPLCAEKEICLYEKQVCIKVPDLWKYKQPYRKFAEYNIKFDAVLSDAKTNTVLKIDVYDSSRIYNNPLNDSLFNERKEAQYKTKGKSVNYFVSEVKQVEGNNVGVLKYSFLNASGKKCFGMQLLFRTSDNDFYEMEFFSTGESYDKCQAVGDRIFQSLHFNSSTPS